MAAASTTGAIGGLQCGRSVVAGCQFSESPMRFWMNSSRFKVAVPGLEVRRGRVRAPMAMSSASTSMFAKEMERVAAKEALLFAIKDAGGVESFAFGRASDATLIEVNEKVLALERLNPTPRPTTSPLLEGLWKFEWAGAMSPAILASNLLIKNLPSASAGLTLLILGGTAKATYNLKVFGSVETSFTLTTSLSVEGPSRLKETYVDGILAPPVIPDGTIPSQLQGFYDQFKAGVDRLPPYVKDSFSGGLKVPLSGRFERLLLVSYLDEEIMIGRDAGGAPDVLFRMESKTAVAVDPVIVPEYQS